MKNKLWVKIACWALALLLAAGGATTLIYALIEIL